MSSGRCSLSCVALRRPELLLNAAGAMPYACPPWPRRLYCPCDRLRHLPGSNRCAAAMDRGNVLSVVGSGNLDCGEPIAHRAPPTVRGAPWARRAAGSDRRGRGRLRCRRARGRWPRSCVRTACGGAEPARDAFAAERLVDAAAAHAVGRPTAAISTTSATRRSTAIDREQRRASSRASGARTCAARARAAVLGRGAAARARRRGLRRSRAPTTCSRSASRPARFCGSTRPSSIPTSATVCCGWTSRGVALGDGKVFVGPARRQARGARSAHRQASLVDSGRALAGRLLAHERAAVLRRARDHGLLGRGARRARPREGASTRRPASCAGRSIRFPGPGEPGHDTWPADNEVGQRGGATVWQTPAVDPELGLLYFSTGQPGAGLQRRRARGRQPVLGLDRRARCAHRSIPLAFPAGASRSLGLRRAESGRAVRRADRRRAAQGPRARSARRAGPTSSIAQTGKPLSGSTSARAAGAASSDGRHAALSARRRDRAAARRHRARGLRARERGPDLHAVRRRRRRDREPEPLRRRELAAELVRSRAAAVCSCARRPWSATSSAAIAISRSPPKGAHYDGGVVGFAPLPRTGIFAALDVTTNKPRVAASAGPTSATAARSRPPAGSCSSAATTGG